jgi:flavin reductase (DIM6/NTAB) family NADH-FMN oxidoreductase RutF
MKKYILIVLVVLQSLTATGQAPTGWTAIKASGITDNPVTLFGHDNMVLSAGKEGDCNGMVIGFGQLGVLWGQPVVEVYVYETRYTREFMERYDHFTLTAFPDSMHRAMLDDFAFQSGRDADKMHSNGFTLKFTEQGNPYFDEGRLVIECCQIYNAPFSSEGLKPYRGHTWSNGRAEKFTVYIGEIENVWVKSKK